MLDADPVAVLEGEDPELEGIILSRQKDSRQKDSRQKDSRRKGFEVGLKDQKDSKD